MSDRLILQKLLNSRLTTAIAEVGAGQVGGHVAACAGAAIFVHRNNVSPPTESTKRQTSSTPCAQAAAPHILDNTKQRIAPLADLSQWFPVPRFFVSGVDHQPCPVSPRHRVLANSIRRRIEGRFSIRGSSPQLGHRKTAACTRIDDYYESALAATKGQTPS